MNVLVLGGSIFIGLHLVRLLQDQGHRVTVLNRGVTKTQLPEGVTRLIADRSDPSQVKAALKDASYEAVFDISGYTPASLDPVIEGLEGRVGHYVFCSSIAVYGPSYVAPVEERFALARGPETSQYGRDKVLCEDLLMEAFNRRAFPVTVLRPPYVYGPHNKLKQREFSFFARLRQGRTIILPGDGYAMFHTVQVDDLASAFAAAPGRSHTLGKAYTVCGPEAISINGWIDTIGEVVGVTPEVVHVDPKEFDALPDKLGLSDSFQIFPYPWGRTEIYTNERARRDLEWSPRYRNREGLAMTYKWWLEQGLDKEPWDFSHEDRALSMITATAGR